MAKLKPIPIPILKPYNYPLAGDIEMFDFDDAHYKDQPSNKIYIVDHEKKIISVKMRCYRSEWQGKPDFRHKESEWIPLGENNFNRAAAVAEHLVLAELEKIRTIRIGMELRIIEGVNSLTNETLFKTKQAIDRRVTEIISKKVSGMISEHKLTTAEESYIAVLLANKQIETSVEERTSTEKLHTQLILNGKDKKELTIRHDKCEAVAEQIITIKNGIYIEEIKPEVKKSKF